MVDVRRLLDGGNNSQFIHVLVMMMVRRRLVKVIMKMMSYTEIHSLMTTGSLISCLPTRMTTLKI